ncbi:MAG: histidine kinase [Bacteroidia bacterium]|nr:histidine kinase [Bacteroidia bacterium]
MGGISLFNGQNFKNIQLKGEQAKKNVTSIVQDRSGSIWLATDGAGICKLNEQNDDYEFTYFTTDDGLPHNYVRALLCDNEGNIWVGTRSGITIRKDGKFQNSPYQRFNRVNVSDIVQGKNGEILISTYGDGVYTYQNNQITNYNKSNGLLSNYIRSITEDNLGNYWLASKKGISKLLFNSSEKKVLTFTTSDGLVTNNIKSISSDYEGNIWIGSDGKGVMKLTGEAFVNYSTKDGLSSDIVMSVVEDADNNIWFSTYGEGLSVINKAENGKIKILKTRDGLGNNTVWCSYIDKNKNIWFGTSDGVSVYANGKFKNYKVEDGLISKKVTTITEDNKGNLWFGCKEGVSKFDPSAERTGGTTFVNFSEENGFNAINVRSILEDSKGNLWFGTSSGLIKYDGIEFKQYSSIEGLKDNTIYTVLEDFNQNLWLGTRSGLVKFDLSAEQAGRETFEAIRIGDSYNSNFINFMIFDDAQHLWVGTNQGIYEMDVPEFYNSGAVNTFHYTNWEGINSLECNLNGAYKDHDGNLWFGTIGGVVKYDPSKAISNIKDVKPSIIITTAQLFLEETNWSEYGSVEESTGLPLDLQLAYDQNHLAFYYTGISHTNPYKVRYQYKLQGFDKEWSPITEAGFATYSNLPHGEFTFKVKASNKFGNWSSEPAVFSFKITPPFWLTWWFGVICALAFGIIAYLTYLWRTNVNKRKLYTQQLIHKSKMLVLEQKALNASMNRHFIFNALNSIQYYINKQDKRAANNYLTNFAKLIRRNLDDSHNNLVSLQEELERLELYLSLENMRFSNKFSYEINVDEDIDKEGIKVPSMLLQPFVENSISHGILPMDKKGKVTVNIRKNIDDELVFEIEDNGIGIEQSLKSKSSNTKPHNSKGVEITKSRLELIRNMANKNAYIVGPIEIKNKNNQAQGTRVEIVFQPN